MAVALKRVVACTEGLCLASCWQGKRQLLKRLVALHAIICVPGRDDSGLEARGGLHRRESLLSLCLSTEGVSSFFWHSQQLP